MIAEIIRGLILLAVVAGGLATWFHFKPEPAPVNVHMPAKPAPQVAHETKIAVPIAPPVKVYRPEVKRKLKLPDAIQNNADQHVIASTRTAGDERPHTITTIIDSSTGESNTLDRAEPLPWIAVSTKTRISAYYGLKNGQQAIRIQGQQDFLRVKAVRFSAIASADLVGGDTQTFIGIGLGAEW